MGTILTVIAELFSSLLSVAVSVLPIIGMWCVFEKAGEVGWKAIIPIYNIYTILKITERKKYFKIYLIGFSLYFLAMIIATAYVVFAFIYMVLFLAGGESPEVSAILSSAPLLIIMACGIIAGGILMLIALVKGYHGICDKMHISRVHTIGLILLPPIFWMLLGVSAQYTWDNTITAEFTTSDSSESSM